MASRKTSRKLSTDFVRKLSAISVASDVSCISGRSVIQSVSQLVCQEFKSFVHRLDKEADRHLRRKRRVMYLWQVSHSVSQSVSTLRIQVGKGVIFCRRYNMFD